MELQAVYNPEKVEKWEISNVLGIRDRGLGWSISVIDDLEPSPRRDELIKTRDLYEQQEKDYLCLVNELFTVTGFKDYFIEHSCDVLMVEVREVFGESVVSKIKAVVTMKTLFYKQFALCGDHFFDVDRKYRYTTQIGEEIISFSVSPMDSTYPRKLSGKSCWWNWREDRRYIMCYLFDFISGYCTDDIDENDDFNDPLYLALEKDCWALFGDQEDALEEDFPCWAAMENVFKCIPSEYMSWFVIKSDYACGQWLYRARQDNTIELCLVDTERIDREMKEGHLRQEIIEALGY